MAGSAVAEPYEAIVSTSHWHLLELSLRFHLLTSCLEFVYAWHTSFGEGSNIAGVRCGIILLHGVPVASRFETQSARPARHRGRSLPKVSPIWRVTRLFNKVT